MKWILVLTLWNNTFIDDVSILDSNMTGADCIAALLIEQPKREESLGFYDFRLSCELDFAAVEE